MRRSSRKAGDARAHGGAVNIAGSVIADVDQVAGHQEFGRRAARRFEFGAPRRSRSMPMRVPEPGGTQVKVMPPSEDACARSAADDTSGASALSL
jgi:hypothetical protein